VNMAFLVSAEARPAGALSDRWRAVRATIGRSESQYVIAPENQ
jgi:hypothetical protein